MGRELLIAQEGENHEQEFVDRVFFVLAVSACGSTKSIPTATPQPPYIPMTSTPQPPTYTPMPPHIGTLFTADWSESPAYTLQLHVVMVSRDEDDIMNLYNPVDGQCRVILTLSKDGSNLTYWDGDCHITGTNMPGEEPILFKPTDFKNGGKYKSKKIVLQVSQKGDWSDEKDFDITSNIAQMSDTH